MQHDIRTLALSAVFANPDQPRKVFETAKLEELAASILKNGLTQPITVVPRGDGRFMIVAGERRWRAHEIAGLRHIDAIVRADLSTQQVAELALIENLLREDLGLVEEARAYQDFIDRGYTVQTLAELLGYKTTVRIQFRLNVLKLDPALLDGLAKGAILPGQAQEMSRLSREGQFALWRSIQDGKCQSPEALKRVAGAIHAAENQVELFKVTMTAREKEALSKVDAFVEAATRLLRMVTPQDLELLRKMPKPDALKSIDTLQRVESQCKYLRLILLETAAKQHVSDSTACTIETAPPLDTIKTQMVKTKPLTASARRHKGQTKRSIERTNERTNEPARTLVRERPTHAS